MDFSCFGIILPCPSYISLQVTPVLGVLAGLLVLLILKEPQRGVTDGLRNSKGVRGKTGITAYLHDIRYLARK